MKTNYIKTLLSTYPRIQKIIEQIDDLVLKKAMSAFSCFSPCQEIAEKILLLTERKKVLIEIRQVCDNVFNKLTIEEYDMIDYKYIKRKSKEYYKNFDYSSKGYFRRQNKLLTKLSSLFFSQGIDDEWFNDNCLNDEYFKTTLRRIINHELNMQKNKPNKKTKPKLLKLDATRGNLKLSA